MRELEYIMERMCFDLTHTSKMNKPHDHTTFSYDFEEKDYGKNTKVTIILNATYRDITTRILRDTDEIPKFLSQEKKDEIINRLLCGFIATLYHIATAYDRNNKDKSILEGAYNSDGQLTILYDLRSIVLDGQDIARQEKEYREYIKTKGYDN